MYRAHTQPKRSGTHPCGTIRPRSVFASLLNNIVCFVNQSFCFPSPSRLRRKKTQKMKLPKQSTDPNFDAKQIAVIRFGSIGLDWIRFDSFLVPMQYTGNWGCFPRVKQTVTAQRYSAFWFPPVCIVVVFPYHPL